jgi:arginine repressor
MKINKEVLLQKIASRKFWALVAGLTGAVLIALNFDEGSTEQIVGIVAGAGTICTYLLSEAMVDSARAKNPPEVTVVEKETEPK